MDGIIVRSIILVLIDRIHSFGKNPSSGGIPIMDKMLIDIGIVFPWEKIIDGLFAEVIRLVAIKVVMV